jgi:GT2 family glycosyltransferase
MAKDLGDTIVVSDVSIVIPTYQREQVLLNTVDSLLQLPSKPAEIILVDQTSEHQPVVSQRLHQLEALGQIRWVRQSKPSIPGAMNHGLRIASSPLVLFLDDDIEPISDLIAQHAAAHEANPDLSATVGQVIQPWQSPTEIDPPGRMTGLRADFDFPFFAAGDYDVRNVMAGNLCVRREQALALGGFDENFRGAAYRFETEFARRIMNAGGRIRFVGSAGIRHLRIASGGTRSEGSHLTSADPRHGIGDYYYAFLHGGRIEKWMYSIHRLFREVATKFHLTHPWWIPIKFVGELRAFLGGYKMARAAKQAKRTA